MGQERVQEASDLCHSEGNGGGTAGKLTHQPVVLLDGLHRYTETVAG
ncbi:hypothetical protein P3T35_007795 [Kitasatospora sp. GP30]|nr:hypothetical protein [Kitasatospora sp. GP30]MDH6145737.1 hypothetical protein [Kitasatospora sp. GP30]